MSATHKPHNTLQGYWLSCPCSLQELHRLIAPSSPNVTTPVLSPQFSNTIPLFAWNEAPVSPETCLCQPHYAAAEVKKGD